MSDRLFLASESEIRARMLRSAGVAFEIMPSRIDEETIKRALEAEEAPPRD
ncbi:MAG: Maf family protein, partial [Octadecabacter sp.]|nr:Maf family protein [Octadecabacter sp.]